MNYGIAITNLRTKAKENQTTFAENIGISQTYLSQIENGRKTPSLDLLEKIAKYTNTPMPILFWHTVTENDISEEKIEAYRLLKPTMDSLIDLFF